MPELDDAPKDALKISQHEIEINEKDKWAPDISLRPHHFTNPDVRAAIGNKTRPKISRTDLFLRGGQIFERATERFSGGYFKDVTGTTSEDFSRFQLSEKDFLDRLSQLPDDAVVCLDIKPDELCNSCVIGKHCIATNVRTKTWPAPAIDRVKQEAETLDKIQKDLVKKGYQEGNDFIFKSADHVVFDFGGKQLNQVTNPTPSNITFNSMLVKMAALREVAQ